MPSTVLVLSGAFALAYGGWRGYVAARAAVAPLLRDGDATRTLVDATRPMHERARVRVAARAVLIAVLWLGVALYGLYLLTVGLATWP